MDNERATEANATKIYIVNKQKRKCNKVVEKARILRFYVKIDCAVIVLDCERARESRQRVSSSNSVVLV